MTALLDSAPILQMATAFWPSKVLLTAVELDVFSALGASSLTAEELGNALGLHPRGTYDFFDCLVALGFLACEGDGPERRYANTPETAAFLVRQSPAYIGGLLEMLNSRLFGFWNNLGTALKTGKPQNEASHGQKPMFEELYSDPDRLAEFLRAMNGFQAPNFTALAEKFDFSRYNTLTDVGGALALLSSLVAIRHPHMRMKSFDLPVVAPHAKKAIEN